MNQVDALHAPDVEAAGNDALTERDVLAGEAVPHPPAWEVVVNVLHVAGVVVLLRIRLDQLLEHLAADLEEAGRDVLHLDEARVIRMALERVVHQRRVLHLVFLHPVDAGRDVHVGAHQGLDRLDVEAYVGVDVEKLVESAVHEALRNRVAGLADESVSRHHVDAEADLLGAAEGSELHQAANGLVLDLSVVGRQSDEEGRRADRLYFVFFAHAASSFRLSMNRCAKSSASMYATDLGSPEANHSS